MSTIHKVSAEKSYYRSNQKQQRHRSQRGSFKQNEDKSAISLGAPLDKAIKYLSCVEDGNKISFACFDEEKNEIVLEECYTHSAKDTEVFIENFLHLFNPTLILVSKKITSNPLLLAMLTKNRTHDNVDTRNNGVTHKNGAFTSTEAQQNNTADYEQNSTIRNTTTSIPFRLIKSSAYEVRKCRDIILNKLRVLTILKQKQKNHLTNANQYNPFGPYDKNFHQYSYTNNSFPVSNYHSLASLIDFESTCLIRAIGSLLSFLQSTIFRLEEGATITINTIRHAHSSSFMKIDSSTLKSLHIFSTEHHPLMSLNIRTEKAKEGFSLFTLLDKTKSKMGRICLRQWMQKPLLSIPKIQGRYDGIDLMLHPDCVQCVTKIAHSLKRIGAVDKILAKIQKCRTAPMDFLILSKTLQSGIEICSLLAEELWQISSSIVPIEIRSDDEEDDTKSDRDDHQPFSVRAKAFLNRILGLCQVHVLRKLHERMASTIDEEITADMKDTVCIHYGFNEELDNAKETFDSLDQTLSAIGGQVLNKHPILRQLKVIYLPQVGFLIALDKTQHAHNIATNEFPDLPPTFSFVFLQDNEVFFKNPDMRQLDEELGDLDAFIKDTEAMILSELEQEILDYESELRNTFDALAELDCIIALSECASDLNLTRPLLCQSGNQIRIENGRHPLQEIILDDDFIPNDVTMDLESRINIVTGPNYSGKSCYLRQVGVLLYMAQIGSFVPCDRAKLCIVDQILARISSYETCVVPQSTFQIDLTEMATILRKSTPASLVLIDEFGKGTVPASGIAVLTSALKHLIKIKCKVVCTTHFLEIFSLGLLNDNMDGVKFLRMTVHIPVSDDDNDEAIPLFKLENGIAESSAGLVCAKMAGVDGKIIRRAKEILTAVKTGCPVQPISSQNNLNSSCQKNMKLALRHFLSVDNWEDANLEDLVAFQKKVVLM